MQKVNEISLNEARQIAGGTTLAAVDCFPPYPFPEPEPWPFPLPQPWPGPITY